VRVFPLIVNAYGEKSAKLCWVASAVASFRQGLMHLTVLAPNFSFAAQVRSSFAVGSSKGIHVRHKIYGILNFANPFQISYVLNPNKTKHAPLEIPLDQMSKNLVSGAPASFLHREPKAFQNLDDEGGFLTTKSSW
jgi:hypothetical protein